MVRKRLRREAEVPLAATEYWFSGAQTPSHGAAPPLAAIRSRLSACSNQRFSSASSASGRSITISARPLEISPLSPSIESQSSSLNSRPASMIRRTTLAQPGNSAERQSMVRRAMRIEAKADRLTLAARGACAKLHDAKELRFVIDEVGRYKPHLSMAVRIRA